MKLSVPVYRLKRCARLMSRERSIPLNKALDIIAAEEGFSSWSLLAAKVAEDPAAARVYRALVSGDMMLIAGRPGHGKTVLGLELVAEGIKAGHRGVFFTLEYNAVEVLERFRAVNGDAAVPRNGFGFDTSDDICADTIIARLADAGQGDIAVIDYLQVLDQKRTNPDLGAQVGALRDFAQARGLILVFLSQIDRGFEEAGKDLPDIADIRLPNPVDLSLFSKTCFLHDGEMRLERF